MGIRDTFLRLFDNERYLQVVTLYNTAKEKYYRGFALFNSFKDMDDFPNDFDYKDFISDHFDDIKYLDDVLNSYDEIINNCKEGLNYYINEKKIRKPDYKGKEKDLFSFKEHIAKSAQTIKEYTSIIRTFNQIESNHKEGYDRFVSLHISQDVDKTIGFMRYINSHERRIKNYDNVIKQYNRLLSSRKEAVRLFLNKKEIEQVAYSTKEEVVCNEGKIDLINSTIREYKSIKSLCPNAVRFYLAEHALDVQSLSFIIDHKELFQTSEAFYIIVSKRLLSKLFIFDLSEEDLTSVSIDNLKAKKSFLEYISMETDSHNKPIFSMENDINVFFDYIKDSASPHTFQRDKENLSDLCDITRIANKNTYALSQVFSLLNGKKDAILSYYRRKGRSESLSYSSIIDYFTDKELGKYIELYEKEKEIRSKASNVANHYPKGFKVICPSSLNWGRNWSIEQCMEVVNKERLIIQENQKIEDDERRKRQQEERKREERLRLQREREKNRLLSKLSRWYTNDYGLKHMWMYAYLPTDSVIYAHEVEWDTRYLIWAFKNNPSRPVKRYTYSEALKIIVKNAVLILEKDLGSDLSKITLVCVPSSNKDINERRFKAFSEELCEKTGMTNAFPKIEITQDAIPERDGGTGNPVLSFDNSFFKNRYILIFDDIMTTGRSIERIRQQMIKMGATPIGALTIGKTIHEHVSEDPISLYKRPYWGY